MPPLHERRSDFVPLAEHFLHHYSEKNELHAVGFSGEAILILQTYSYPGNVRELENMKLQDIPAKRVDSGAAQG